MRKIICALDIKRVSKITNPVIARVENSTAAAPKGGVLEKPVDDLTFAINILSCLIRDFELGQL